MRAVIWAESGFRQDAVSAKGAVGMMQLMPATATELGVDPGDMTGNLRGGTRYLRQLLERYSGGSGQLVKALAAYNAGPRPGREVRWGAAVPGNRSIRRQGAASLPGQQDGFRPAIGAVVKRCSRRPDPVYTQILFREMEL